MRYLTSKFHFQGPLELTQDLGARNSSTRFILLYDGRLFIHFLSQVFLSETHLRACSRNRLINANTVSLARNVTKDRKVPCQQTVELSEVALLHFHGQVWRCVGGQVL